MSNILISNPEAAIEAIAAGMAKSVTSEIVTSDTTKEECFEVGVALGMVWLWRRMEKSCSDANALLVAMLDDRS